MNAVSPYPQSEFRLKRILTAPVLCVVLLSFLFAGCDFSASNSEDLAETTGALSPAGTGKSADTSPSSQSGKSSLSARAGSSQSSSNATFSGGGKTSLAANAYQTNGNSLTATKSPVSLTVFAKTICCMLPDGFAETMTHKQCKIEGGQIVSDKECKKEPVSMCCELPNGTFTFMTNFECKDLNGQWAAISDCQEVEDVCCLLEDGNFAIVPSDE